MPFFPRFHYPAETNTHYTAFPTDILRVFDELDRATSSTGSSTSASSTHRRAFSPTFDVHETEREYVLEGEFPGLSDKKNINIEFTDDKTILISGKIEREFKGVKDEQGKGNLIESAEEQKKIEGDKTTAGQEDDKSEKSEKNVEKIKEKSKGPKYWVSERSVGEFSRSFSFPGHVDIDQVKASLEHGILKIVVPKMEKKTGRKIEIH
ncbi:HSP20-like chaperone [Pyronema omphalodes]|nr:HSP20-like chaperone [Pyronema omphalodes]